ncbi:hypothetical protein V2J09_016069 [Rumex salicifolius]
MDLDATEAGANKLRIIVERNPPESKLSELGIKFWPKWGCRPGKYNLKFDAQETCYLVKGKVKVYTKQGSSSIREGEEPSSSSTSSSVVEFGAGDLVIIPKGLSCTWEVSLSVDKFYKFDSS